MAPGTAETIIYYWGLASASHIWKIFWSIGICCRLNSCRSKKKRENSLFEICEYPLRIMGVRLVKGGGEKIEWISALYPFSDTDIAKSICFLFSQFLDVNLWNVSLWMEIINKKKRLEEKERKNLLMLCAFYVCFYLIAGNEFYFTVLGGNPFLWIKLSYICKIYVVGCQ